MSPRRFFVACLCAATFTACAQPAPAPPPPLVANVTTVERRTMATYVELDGTVDPFLAANLAPQQSGTLVAIYANEGDRVRKGETLAKIDDSTLRANLTQQQGVNVQNVAKLSQSKIQLPITNQTYDTALVQAQRALVQQKKTEIADEAAVRNTKLTYDADYKLLAQGYVAESTFEQARAAYVAARETLAQDTDKLVQAQAAVDAARQNLANTPLQRQVIAQNQGAVVQGRGLVQQYETAIDQTTITAPFDGVVTLRTLDPGSYASPSQAIFSVAQIDPIYVDFNVRDVDLGRARPGTLVTFATSSNPDRRYTGRVTSVDAVPQPGTLLYRARIVQANPDYSLRGGLEVSVRLTESVHQDALTVPRGAVVQTGNHGSIYLLTHDGDHYVAHRTQVTLGLQSSSYVEIAGKGVRPGALVLLDQTDNLSDGMSIATPGPSSSPSASP